MLKILIEQFIDDVNTVREQEQITGRIASGEIRDLSLDLIQAYEKMKEREDKRNDAIATVKKAMADSPARLLIGGVEFEFPRLSKCCVEDITTSLGRARELEQSWKDYYKERIVGVQDELIEKFKEMQRTANRESDEPNHAHVVASKAYMDLVKWSLCAVERVPLVLLHYVNDNKAEKDRVPKRALEFTFSHNFDLKI